MNNDSKKIKLVAGISDFRVGGAQKVLADIIRNIDPTSFEVHLIVLTNGKNQETFYDQIPFGVVVHKLQFTGFKDLKSWKKLYMLLVQIKPDIVWSHLYLSNTIFRTLKPFFSYKVITVEHNTYVNKTFLQKKVDWFLSLFTYKIVAVSDYVADFTVSQEHIPRKKFVTILNGVNVSFYRQGAQSTDVAKLKSELGFQSEDKVIISVGQLITQKNHSLLIDAFAEFVKTHSAYKLIILGEGSLRTDLERKIRQYGLDNKIKLLGIQKNTSQFYAISDFFVLTSLFEGFALVCIEAMACGLPVLSTHVAGPDKYISENMDGFFFEPVVDKLYEKMCLVASMNNLDKQKMRDFAINKSHEYDLQLAVHRYEYLFRESVKKQIA